MHAHEPRDKEVATTLTGKLGGRLEVVHDGDEEVSEPEINPRQTPEEENQQAPEAERCVDVEIHPFPAARRIEVEGLVPGTTGPPPDDDTCDAEYTQQGTADGVDFPSGLTREQVVVEIGKPLHHGDRARMRVAHVGAGVRIESLLQDFAVLRHRHLARRETTTGCSNA